MVGLLRDPLALGPPIDALKDRNESVRRHAAWTLGKIGDSRATESLITALKDESQWIRGSAAEALGRIGDPRAVESRNIFQPDIIAAIEQALEEIKVD